MWVWGPVTGFEPTLILERMPGIQIIRGFYNLRVSLNTVELNNYENIYHGATETFINICNNLTRQIPISTCREVHKNMLLTNKDIENKGAPYEVSFKFGIEEVSGIVLD